MQKKPFILITNDDGIHAPGLFHLWQALKEQADIAIIAPHAEQSSVGLGITIRHPLHIHEIGWKDNTPAWSISGTPGDCIKLALHVILKKRPDIIVSGINRGANAGRAALYSGTVGGAIEAVLQDIPAIAFSHSDYTTPPPDYAAITSYIPKFLEFIHHYPLPSGTLLNVNFPSATLGPVKGVKLARQGKGYWAEKPDERSHPSEGHPYYWMGASYRAFEEETDADVHLLEQGFITAVPLHVAELTDHLHFRNHREKLEKLFE